MWTAHVTFRSGDVPFAGTLSLPDGAGPFPALLLAPGSGHHDRDETVCGKKPFRTIADYFADRGYAVLRFDDRGVGETGGRIEEASFQTRVDDMVAAFDFLASHPKVKPGSMAFVGHSEGGLVAAAASRQRPAPVVMLAGPAVDIEELLHRQASVLSLEAGAGPEQIAHELRMNTEVFACVRRDQSPQPAIVRHLKAWPGRSWSDAEITEAAGVMTAVVTATDYSSLLRQDPHAILAGVARPMLALYGGLDTQVHAGDNLFAFLLATKNNPDAEGRILATMNHLFQRAKSGSISEYETLGDTPAEEVLEQVEVWLHSVLSKS